jgi:DNA-binding PadR family transcriptional regulator
MIAVLLIVAGAVVLSAAVLVASYAAHCTARERAVLSVLLAGEMSGPEIVAATDGAVTRGTVYVILAGLEERGLVSSRVEPQGAVRVVYTRRLRYTLTDDGVATVVPS